MLSVCDLQMVTNAFSLCLTDGASFVFSFLLISQVVFISETPVGVHQRTSMKEHLVRHGSKHKI